MEAYEKGVKLMKRGNLHKKKKEGDIEEEEKRRARGMGSAARGRKKGRIEK